jgi:TolB-like protein
VSRQPSLGDFARHAKRGFFWRALGVYILGSWIALQVVDVLVSSFGLPDWFPGFALALLVIGLPIILATAIVQQGLAGGAPGTVGDVSGVDGAPSTGGARHGGRPRAPAAPSPGNLATGTGSLDRPTTRPPRLYRLLTWRNAITGGVLAFALWGVLAAVWLGLTQWVAGDPNAAGGLDHGDFLKAIAVLPFDNLSSDAENAHFADGIHEDVLTQLSKIADLTVISRTSVLPYRETELSLGEIARELGVGSILEGSVRRSGDNVRITAQLIDSRTDEHLWADNFDRALTVANVFAIQTEIAQQIAVALQATLSPEEASRIAHQPTDNLTAYDLYLRAREAYARYLEDDNEEAIRLYRQALEIDPDYSDAWAGIADAYAQRVLVFGYPETLSDSVILLANRAIQLDPESPAGYKAKALAHSIRQQFRLSLESNLAAVERDPNHHGATNNAGVDHDRLGRLDESLRWYKRSARLDPIAFGPGNVATTYAQLGELERARAVFSEHVDQPQNAGWIRALYGATVEIDGGDVDAAMAQMLRWRDSYQDLAIMHSQEAEFHLVKGDFEAALASAERARDMSPDGNRDLFYFQKTGLGYAMLRAGDAEEGRRLLEEQASEHQAAIDGGADRPLLWWEMGAIQAALGNPDAALDLMEEARERGFQAARTFYADLDPMVESVRDDPRFQALVADSRAEIEEMRRRIEAEEIRAGER